jgi:chorismate synthase
MASNSFGNIFKITTFGESHGVAIGVVIDGCPPGIEITQEYIQNFVNERKSGNNPYTTPRKEDDIVEIISGIYKNKTLGTPITLLIKNTNHNSQDYANLEHTFRPNHGDITWFNKYHHVDYRGGGRASARETASRVAAASIAYKILESYNVEIIAYLSALGDSFANEQDLDFSIIKNNFFFSADSKIIPHWQNIMENLIESGDSIGASIKIIIKNPPKNLGEPVYEKINSHLARGIFSIPAVKSLEFGDSDIKYKKGSQNNDAIVYNNNQVEFKSNNSSGILGGITTGQDIILNIGIKPTSSIAIEQSTINNNFENTTIKIKGRHDPCVGIRAVPVCKAMCALSLVDLILHHKLNS